MGKAEFDADFNLLENLQKNLAKLLTEKLQKNGVVYFYYCEQKFSAYNLSWVNVFALFFQRIRTRHQILRLWYFMKNADISTFC